MQYCQFLGHQQLLSQFEQIPNHEPYAQDFLADRLHENNVVKKGLRPLLTRIALSCSVTRLGCFFLAKKIPITFGLTAVTKAKEEKGDGKNKKKEEKAKEITEKRIEREREIVSGRYTKNLKLSRVSRQARKRETDAVTTGPRETENAPRRGV
ncbi:hypothetical protein ALC53_07137 [Atta colombica]|uniref:Uncharacterized protein n=1 Tax=Atta colombica TaxID=520822 RepID=A0A195BDQ9_9HYME|nr:hypothetical protein ALC53_07137 [Atta colombica]